MKKAISVIAVIMFCTVANAQTDSLKGLQQDIYLHPANANTAYTLRKKEMVLQPGHHIAAVTFLDVDRRYGLAYG